MQVDFWLFDQDKARVLQFKIKDNSESLSDPCSIRLNQKVIDINFGSALTGPRFPDLRLKGVEADAEQTPYRLLQGT